MALIYVISYFASPLCTNNPNIFFRMDDAGAYGTENLSMEVMNVFIDANLPLLIGVIPFPAENGNKLNSDTISINNYYSDKFLDFLNSNDEIVSVAMHGITHSVNDVGYNQLLFEDELIYKALEDFILQFDSFKESRRYIAPWNYIDSDAIERARGFQFTEYHTSTKNNHIDVINGMHVIPSSMSLRHFLARGPNTCFDKNIIVQFHPYDFDEFDGRSYTSASQLKEQINKNNPKALHIDELIFDTDTKFLLPVPMLIRKYLPSLFWLNFNDVRHNGIVDLVFGLLLAIFIFSVSAMKTEKASFKSSVTLLCGTTIGFVYFPLKLKFLVIAIFLGVIFSLIVKYMRFRANLP